MSDIRREWTDEEKAIAYQVYFLKAERSIRKTREILLDLTAHENIDTDALGTTTLDIPERTLRYWKTHDHWEERFERDFRSLAPAIHQQVSQQLYINSIKAVDLMGEIIDGTVGGDPKDLKVRWDAAKTGLMMTGHMFNTRPSDDSAPKGPTRDYSQSAAGLDSGQLLAKLMERAAGRIPPEEET